MSRLIYIFLIVAVIIGIIVGLYIIIFNRNANRVLKSGKANILLDKGPFINLFSSISTLILLIIIIFQVSSLSNQKTIIENLGNRIAELEQRIFSLNSHLFSLDSKFNKFMEEQQNAYDFKFDFSDVDIDEKNNQNKNIIFTS